MGSNDMLEKFLEGGWECIETICMGAGVFSNTRQNQQLWLSDSHKPTRAHQAGLSVYPCQRNFRARCNEGRQ